ncbi:MAG: DUF5060 domain-containing protein [Saprospiraceae bacterium]|nr:DUF5060 domain-containing protein [Saprospiraceae bacterium]
MKSSPLIQRLLLVIIYLFILQSSGFSLPRVLFSRANHDTLGRYEKYELSLDIKADFINPFDPSQIDLLVTYTAPSGKSWTIPGFYNYNSWQAVWMTRFSPNETGTWNCHVKIKDKTGTNDSLKTSFFVIPSKLKGPVKIAGNKRFLQYANGDDFFGVGLWYNDSYAAYNQGRIMPESLDELKQLGVNFISTFITPLETHGTGLGRYDQAIAGRLDEVLNLCEERDIQLSLNIWFHSYLSETVWGGGNIRWNTNPYKQITAAKDFYRSEEAWKYQEQLYRYFIARWGYSNSLLLWFIIDEVNGTDGWTSGDSLGAAQWGRKVHDYFKANDPYGHLTTGTRSGGIGEFWHEGYQTFDLASREIYEAQGFPIIRSGYIDSSEIHPLTLSYSNYAHQIERLWKGYDKPAIIGETGWDHTFYEPSMPGYQAMYHNALWVTLAKGTAMTPFWWAHSGYLNDNIITNQIRNISRFAREIPFAKLSNLMPIDSITGGKNSYAMSSDQLIYGWVVNPESDVTGASVSIKLKNIPRNNNTPINYKLRIYHTWRGAFVHEAEVTAQNGKIEFTLPVLKIAGGRGFYIGQDAAFILEPIR